MNHIVVDTNVLVGALLRSKGDNREVLRRCFNHQAKPLIGNALFREYEDLFERPEPLGSSPIPYDDRQQLYWAFLSVCEWVRVYYLWRPNLPDEADNHLIELAVAGGADVIITNNIRDLQHGDLQFPQIQVLTPSEYLTLFQP